jgi:PadR family transcriptional regulator, regulatory protein PadR
MTMGKENKDPNNLMTATWSRKWCVPVILLMLRQWNSYGYELMEKLAAFGLQAMNPGTFYRMLRRMEKDGMVSSTWDISVAGPARRVYSLTQAGEAYLKFWAESLEQYQKMMNTFFELYTLPIAQRKKEDD